MKNLENSEKIEMATAFDTMWAIMLALKEASIALSTSNRPLEYNMEQVIGSDMVTSTIQSKLRNVSFEGLTVITLYMFFFSFFSHSAVCPYSYLDTTLCFERRGVW